MTARVGAQRSALVLNALYFGTSERASEAPPFFFDEGVAIVRAAGAFRPNPWQPAAAVSQQRVPQITRLTFTLLATM